MSVLEKYDEIMNIILPTLREKEEKLIVHFYLFVRKTGKVLEVPLISMDKKSGKVIFDNNGEKIRNKYFKWKL